MTRSPTPTARTARRFLLRRNGAVRATGWTLELRIPSRRAALPLSTDVQTWGIARIPQPAARLPLSDVQHQNAARQQLLICHEQRMSRPDQAPPRRQPHLVLAPCRHPEAAGAPRRGRRRQPAGAPVPAGRAGLDAKWTPNANTAIDATINPDFSPGPGRTWYRSRNQRFAVLSRSARSSWRGWSSSRPRSGGLHPHDHLAGVGGAGDRGGRRRALPRPGRRRPRGRRRGPHRGPIRRTWCPRTSPRR